MFREKNIGVLILHGRGLRYSNFQILTTRRNPRTRRYSMPSAQKPSNIKHGGGIRPNVWVLTFAPRPPVYNEVLVSICAVLSWYSALRLSLVR